MKQVNLYIGSEKLDLPTGEVVAVTLTANNYEEPDKVNSSYTNTFKLPWTRQNIKAVGALMANERTDSQYAINESLLKYEAIDVFGSLHIFEGNPNEAEAAFISGIVQFFDDLGDATLWCLFNSNTFANTRSSLDLAGSNKA